MFNECEMGGQHDWREEYYGHRCAKCLTFYAFGCAAWDADGSEDHYLDDENDCGEDTCVCADANE